MRNRGVIALLACLPALATLPAHAQSHELAKAEHSYQDVDFPGTHLLALRALQAGGASRSETARLYVLLGISAAALDNAEEAKQNFVVALAVDPALKLEKKASHPRSATRIWKRKAIGQPPPSAWRSTPSPALMPDTSSCVWWTPRLW